MSVHNVRESWENRHLPTRSDAEVQRDLEWVWKDRRQIGPPYDETHHDWMAARAAITREARRRGLDLSVVKLS